VITNFAVLPIAGSALFLTISHYRSWQMWLLYLVLAIIVWTTLNGIAFFILYDSERYGYTALNLLAKQLSFIFFALATH
jgi:hypothetical protein